jgi:hypothetical protein
MKLRYPAPEGNLSPRLRLTQPACADSGVLVAIVVLI